MSAARRARRAAARAERLGPLAPRTVAELPPALRLVIERASALLDRMGPPPVEPSALVILAREHGAEIDVAFCTRPGAARLLGPDADLLLPVEPGRALLVALAQGQGFSQAVRWIPLSPGGDA